MFVDRKPTRPNRYKVTPENGEAYYVTLERADEPTEEGTPLNAKTLNSLVTYDNLVLNLSDRVPIPSRATVGQYLRISAVDANGKILAVEAVDLNETVLASLEGV